MNTEQIMALADAYADEQRDWGNGSERTRIARAALEAALTEKQEPVIVDCPFCMHSYQLKDAVTHPAPVNQQLLSTMEWLDRWMGHKPLHECADKVRAAIAAAKGKV